MISINNSGKSEYRDSLTVPIGFFSDPPVKPELLKLSVSRHSARNLGGATGECPSQGRLKVPADEVSQYHEQRAEF
jgi:hypothetical protein